MRGANRPRIKMVCTQQKFGVPEPSLD